MKWKKGSDIIKDIPVLLHRNGFRFSDVEIGGFGSVHLYIASKNEHL